jgi:predicted nucleic acid-binding protein
MTNLVVDSSVVVKWFVHEALSAEAMAILDGFQAGYWEFLAPDLLHAEIGNIAWKKHMLRGLPAADANRIVTSFRRIPFTLTSTADLLEDAYGLAVQYQRSVYDMLYVALSRRERCSFVTADEKLANSLKDRIPSVIWLGNWN